MNWCPVQIVQITKQEDYKYALVRPRKWEHRYTNNTLSVASCCPFLIISDLESAFAAGMQL